MPNTPTSEPAVPSASTRPTTRPVCSTSRSWDLTVSGLTALSSAAGRKNAIAARKMIVTGLEPSAPGPRARMIGTAAMAAPPPSASAAGSNDRGSMRSARRPPDHVPVAMPASTTPMTPVNVSSETPTYGAIRRPASVSRTRTLPDATNTSAPAYRACMAGDRTGGGVPNGGEPSA